MEISLNRVNEYYSSVDKELLGKLYENPNFKNLIELSTQTDLFIFDRKNRGWNLKSKSKLKKECEQIKKKELRNSSSVLSNLAKLNGYTSMGTQESPNNIDTTTKVKKLCERLENKIVNLDKILHQLDNTETFDIVNITEAVERSTINTVNTVNYIECYSNC